VDLGRETATRAAKRLKLLRSKRAKFRRHGRKALHTINSAGSTWIPYELGRAKARKIFSSQAAGWFDPPKILSSGCPEYVYLAHQTFSHQDVEDWLMKRGRYA
jgi:hypothetical protein